MRVAPDWGFPGPQPQAAWASQEVQIVFSQTIDPAFGDVTGVTWRGWWRSALFDLQPWLEGAFGAQPTAQPIWPTQSPDSIPKLYVRFDATNAAIQGAMNVYSMEDGHPTDPGKTRMLAQREEITDAYYDHCAVASPFSGLLLWEPPQGLMRYWRASVVFDVITATVTPPTITGVGAVY